MDLRGACTSGDAGRDEDADLEPATDAADDGGLAREPATDATDDGGLECGLSAICRGFLGSP